MRCGRDPHRGQAVFDTSGTSRHLRTTSTQLFPKQEANLSDKKVQVRARLLKAEGNRLHTYQTGADSSNRLMGSSAKHIDSTVRLSSVTDESNTVLCFIRGEEWQFEHCSLTAPRSHSFKDNKKVNFSIILRLHNMVKELLLLASQLNFGMSLEWCLLENKGKTSRCCLVCKRNSETGSC